MAVYEAIRNLVQYGVNTGLLQESDRIYATNQILEVLGLDEYEEPQGACREISLEETLDALLDYAHETGVLKEDGVVYRDLFDTKLMNCLMPRPSEVIGHFWKLYEESPEAATNYYYKLSQDSNYIRRYRVSKDMKWNLGSICNNNWLPPPAIPHTISRNVQSPRSGAASGCFQRYEMENRYKIRGAGHHG